MASLGDLIAALRDRAAFEPEVSGLHLRHLQELRTDGHEYDTLNLGDAFPSFELLDHKGATIRSDELLARGPLVVSLFHGTWCRFCEIELRLLNETHRGITRLGAELVAISPQSAESAGERLAQRPVTFRILVDPGARFAASLNLAHDFPAYLREIYRDVFKIDLAKINAEGSWRLPIPGRFVVNVDGIIADAEYDPDFR